jgi:hypothetical protein
LSWISGGDSGWRWFLSSQYVPLPSAPPAAPSPPAWRGCLAVGCRLSCSGRLGASASTAPRTRCSWERDRSPGACCWERAAAGETSVICPLLASFSVNAFFFGRSLHLLIRCLHESDFVCFDLLQNIYSYIYLSGGSFLCRLDPRPYGMESWRRTLGICGDGCRRPAFSPTTSSSHPLPGTLHLALPLQVRVQIMARPLLRSRDPQKVAPDPVRLLLPQHNHMVASL